MRPISSVELSPLSEILPMEILWDLFVFEIHVLQKLNWM